MTLECQLVLFLPGDPVLGGDVFRREAHVVGVEDLPEAVMDHQVGDLAEGHVHPVTPAGIRHCVRDIAHVLHAARHDDVGVTGTDGLGSQGDGLHPRGADLLNGDYVRLLGETGVDRRLARRILAAACSQDVAHDDLVKIHRNQGTVVGIVFLLNVRHIELAEDRRPGRLDKVVNGRTEPRPDNCFLDDQPAHFYNRNTLQ